MSAKVAVSDSLKGTPPAWAVEVPSLEVRRYVTPNEAGEMMVVDFHPVDLWIRITTEGDVWPTCEVGGLRGDKLWEFEVRLSDEKLRMVVPDEGRFLQVTPMEAALLLAILSDVPHSAQNVRTPGDHIEDPSPDTER